MDDLTPTERLLVALCGDGDTPLDGGQGLRALDAGRLLQALVAASARHNVQGLVLSALLGSPAAMDLFARQLDQVRSSLSLLTRQATFWDLEQDRVLGAMARAGFQPLVLKGGALRRWVYRAPVERAVGDLDILVAWREVPQVLAVLSGLGYESSYSEAARRGFRAHLYHDRVTHANGFHVEVHWGLTRPAAHIHLDPDSFLARSHVLENPGAPGLRVPSAEDMILHTVGQSHQAGVRKLRRLVDLDRIVASQDLNWDYVIAQAKGGNLYATLCITHRLASLLLGTAAPDELLDGRGLSRSSRMAIACMRPVPRLLRDPGSGHLADDVNLMHLWCLQGWRERGRSLGAWASGSRDPLEWVWAEDEPPVVEPGRHEGLRAVSKILAQQVAVLLSLGWRLMVPGRRRGLRFWKDRGKSLNFGSKSVPRSPSSHDPPLGDRRALAGGASQPSTRAQLPPEGR